MRHAPLALGLLAAALAGAASSDDGIVRELIPRGDAEPRAHLEIHPVQGLDGPTGDQVWILHRRGRHPRWSGCSDGTLWTDSLNLSLGRPDRDTAWEPHLVVHELMSWFVPEPLAKRVARTHRISLHACNMVWIAKDPTEPN